MVAQKIHIPFTAGPPEDQGIFTRREMPRLSFCPTLGVIRTVSTVAPNLGRSLKLLLEI